MAKLNLDISKFEHVCSDDSHTTLRNKAGHEVKILRKALSDDMRTQMEALAKTSDKPEVTTEKDTPRQYAEGGNVSLFEGVDPADSISANAARIGVNAIPKTMGAINSLMAAGDKSSVPQWAQETARSSPAFAPAPDQMSGATATLSSPVEEVVMPADPGIAQLSALGADQEVAAMRSQQASSPMGLMSSGYNDIQKGMKDQAAAQIQAADSIMKQREAQALAQKEAVDTYAMKKQELDSEREALMQDVQNGQVDPDKYWNNHSKVAAGIGMIIAGFNPTNSPNAAINFLKQQMENNLRAQEKNLDSKHNLLAANLKQYGNLNDATTMTRIMQNDMLVNQMEMAAAKAQSPLIKAQLLQNAGKLKMEFAPLVDKMARSQATASLMSQANQNPAKIPAMLDALSASDPERAKELRGRLVPGAGFANTLEGAKGVNEMQTMVKTATDDIGRLKALAKSTGKSVNPSVIAEADTIRRGLIGKLRVPITGPGAMSEGEREMLENMVPDVTAIFALDSSNKKRLDTLAQRMQNNYANMAQANGLNVATPKANSIEEGARGTFKGQPVVRQNGKWVPIK